MKTTLFRWFTPPVFPNDVRKTRRAAVLNSINISVLIFSALLFLGNLAGGSSPTSVVVITILFFCGSLVIQVLVHQKRIDIAGNGLTLIGFITATSACLSLGTIRTPTTAGYILLVVMAGAILGHTGILVYTLMSSLAVLGLILAENAGLLPEPNYAVNITQWVTYTLLFAVSGSLTYYVNRRIQDTLEHLEKEIDERRLVEAELRKLTWAVEQSASAIMITDLDGIIEYVNPRFTVITGYELAEVKGTNHRTPPLDFSAGNPAAHFWSAAEGHREWHAEFENTRKGGSRYFESITISPITDASGKVSNYLAVMEDITQRKRAEAEILRLNSELEARVQERTAELAAANHRLEEKYAELEKAQANLNDLFTKYKIVSDNTFDWEYWQGEDGQFLYSSPSCERATGYKPEDFQREPDLMEKIILPEYHAAWQLHKLEYQKEHSSGQLEFPIRRADQSIVWISHHCQPVYDENGRYLGHRGSNRDVTQRKLADDRLRHEAERANILANITARFTASLGLESVLGSVCEETCRLLDAPVCIVWLSQPEPGVLRPMAVYGVPSEVLTEISPLPLNLELYWEQKYNQIFYDRDIQQDARTPNLALLEKLNLHTGVNCWFSYEGQVTGLLTILRHEIAWEYRESDYILLYTLRNQFAIAIHNAQLFEQVRAGRERLAAVSSRLIEIQEAERRSLALELHDQLGQMLSSTKISLDMIPSLPPESAADQLLRARELISELIVQVRRMSLDLRPSMLDDMGLFPTLRWLFKNYQARTGEKVEFDQGIPDQRFQPKVEITAFRIVQEALTNVIRHAGSQKVSIQAQADQRALQLLIRDYGCGFDPLIRLQPGESSGLSGMRERARLSGGDLMIESQPGVGTSLLARLPLDPSQPLNP